MGKKLSREEEERLWMISIVPFVPVLIGIIAYLAHLKSIGAIPSFQAVIFYILLATVLLLAAGAGTYEVVSSFKVKRTLMFRSKRFLSRTLFASALILGFCGVWSSFTLFLSSVLKMEYILILSLFAVSFTFFILAKNKRTGQIIKKLTMEEY